ncbi:MAG TPA: ATP-binding protein [Roseiflexaceae bacterium]|nr:ATP-binding protein [Roseiflexaceae bacterium]
MRLPGMPVSSLIWKLTLAFMLVGLLGAILVALLISQRTRSEFDRFRSERDRSVLIDALTTYYTTRNGWEGVGAMLDSTPPLDFYSRDVALADANGMVVRGSRSYPAGEKIAAPALMPAMRLIRDEGGTSQTIGYLLWPVPPERVAVAAMPGPEGAFLQRVGWASAISALVAAAFALVLGILLARTLTRPIRELTEATRAMAGGQLDQQVRVYSRDEIGLLAASFNQMSADLARASQLRKQMTADLAHDLRTPLSILRGYTEGLKDDRLQGSPALYTLMHEEVVHLQRLVDDLRVLSLTDAGELTLNRRTVDPSALLERTGLAYFHQAEQQGVMLRVAAAEELPSIAVDTDRMTQVLNNLVSNALRHTPAGGTITLSAVADGQYTDDADHGNDLDQVELKTQHATRNTQHAVLISVCDTGAGIEAEDLPQIFHRFYRADKARQRIDSTGSGLGLAIARALVEAHGGTIAVDSAPGRGTTFTIALPAARRPALAASS